MSEKEMLEVDVEDLKHAYDKLIEALYDLREVEGLDEEYEELNNIAETINDTRIKRENKLERMEEIA